MRGKRAGFQIKQREAFEQVVVENQINVKVRRFSADAELSADKRKAFAQFEQESLQVFDQRGFDFFFAGAMRSSPLPAAARSS